VPIEDLLTPKFWTFCRDLKPHDRIEIAMPDADGRLYAFVLEVVRNVGATGPVMQPYPSEPPGLRHPVPHAAEEKGPALKALEHTTA